MRGRNRAPALARWRGPALALATLALRLRHNLLPLLWRERHQKRKRGKRKTGVDKKGNSRALRSSCTAKAHKKTYLAQLLARTLFCAFAPNGFYCAICPHTALVLPASCVAHTASAGVRRARHDFRRGVPYMGQFQLSHIAGLKMENKPRKNH